MTMVAGRPGLCRFLQCLQGALAPRLVASKQGLLAQGQQLGLVRGAATAKRGKLKPRERDSEANLHVLPRAGAYYTSKVVPLNLDNEVVGTFTLPGDIFNVPVRRDIIHQVVRWQLAKRRQGTHKTKNRAEVRGGGRKPWPQKGTGRARAGSKRSPIFRGGGHAHPKVPRSYAFKLNKQYRRLGLKCALSAKVQDNRLVVVDSLMLKNANSGLLRARLEKLLEGRRRLSALLVDAGKEDNTDGGVQLRRAALPLQFKHIEVVPQAGANVYSLLRRDVLVISKKAVEQLTTRLRTPINRLGAAGRSYPLKYVPVYPTPQPVLLASSLMPPGLETGAHAMAAGG